MTILYQTDFPTDQNPVSSPFTNFFGSLKVEGGLLQLVAQNTFSVIGDTGRTYPTDYISSIIIDTFDSGDFGPAARVSGDGCYFTINVNGTDIWLYKYTGGFSQIGTWAGVVYPTTGARKIGLKVTNVAGDTLIDLVINDVEFGAPVTDPDPFPTAGVAGGSGYSGNWRVAGFVSEDLNVGVNPVITSVDDSTPQPGNVVTLTVTDAGATQGTGGVTLGGEAQAIGSWSDTSIPITIARGGLKFGTQPLVVTADGGAASAAFNVTLTPPAGWSVVNIVTPHPNPALRLRSRPDLASGDQIHYDNRGGLVTVLNDGTVTVDPSVYSFHFEIWSSSGGGWGQMATQVLYVAQLTDAKGMHLHMQRVRHAVQVASSWLDPYNWGGVPLRAEKWFAPELQASAYTQVVSDLALTWNVQNAVISDRTLSYDVLNAVQADLGLAWGVQGSAQADLGLAWGVQGSAQADLTLSYNVINAVQADLGLAWGVQGSTFADLTISYGVQGSAQADLALSWAVEEPGTAQADLALSWGIAGPVFADLALSWGVFNEVTADRTLTWAVLGSAFADLTFGWDVIGSAQRDLALSWGIAGTAERDLALSWSISPLGGGSGATPEEIAAAIWAHVLSNGKTADLTFVNVEKKASLAAALSA